MKTPDQAKAELANVLVSKVKDPEVRRQISKLTAAYVAAVVRSERADPSARKIYAESLFGRLFG